jgi:hypothetical protein
MRTLGLALLSLAFLGCSSDKSGDDDSGTGTDSGVKPEAGVDAGKDAGIMDAGSDAAKLDGYYAWGHAGAPNRLFIYFADAQNDVCYRLHLENGTNMTAVTIPNGWNLLDIGTGAVHSAQACSPYYSGNAEILQNLSSSGTLNWSGTVPPTVYTVDVTLNFAPSTWAASSQQLMTMNLPVTMF